MKNKYKFVKEKVDYSAFASGQVFYSKPGFTAFPVQLASEIFQISLSHLSEMGVKKPYVLYDPCCGSGQLLTTLGFLHGNYLSQIIGSDVDGMAVEFAEKNLGLLTTSGLDKRINELQQMAKKFNKESHKTSLRNAISFKEKLNHLQVKIFQADVTNASFLQRELQNTKLNLVITDVPYGRESSWLTTANYESSPVLKMMESLLPILSNNAVVVIATNRQQKLETHPAFEKIDSLKLVKRRLMFYTQKS